MKQVKTPTLETRIAKYLSRRKTPASATHIVSKVEGVESSIRRQLYFMVQNGTVQTQDMNVTQTSKRGRPTTKGFVLATA